MNSSWHWVDAVGKVRHDFPERRGCIAFALLPPGVRIAHLAHLEVCRCEVLERPSEGAERGSLGRNHKDVPGERVADGHDDDDIIHLKANKHVLQKVVLDWVTLAGGSREKSLSAKENSCLRMRSN